jgi:hypothetical protein
MKVPHIEKIWAAQKQSVVSVFIAVFLYATFSWNLPASRARTMLIRPIVFFMQILGLRQNFETFGPNPLFVNSRLFAVVTYSDCSRSVWLYPQLENLDALPERLSQSRYRIFYSHHLHCDKFLWPDFARFVARSQNHFAGKKPVCVQLLKQIDNIPAMNPQSGAIDVASAPRIELLTEQNISAADLDVSKRGGVD